jgi:hypothetical protein
MTMNISSPESRFERRKTTKEADIAYAAKRKKFLQLNPWCEVALLRGQQVPSTHVHHTKGRIRHYLDESTWLAVTKEGDDWIHANTEEAYQLGFLKDEYFDMNGEEAKKLREQLGAEQIRERLAAISDLENTIRLKRLEIEPLVLDAIKRWCMLKRLRGSRDGIHQAVTVHFHWLIGHSIIRFWQVNSELGRWDDFPLALVYTDELDKELAVEQALERERLKQNAIDRVRRMNGQADADRDAAAKLERYERARRYESADAALYGEEKLNVDSCQHV